ncbi:MAG TPA: phage baseplate assembly protein V, partial [Pseudacidobacterium sp.]|nr:phage baseplate assembly protein V [Pseudacidobacterium sp.]
MALPFIQIGDDLLQNSLLASVEVVQELNHHWWCTIVCRQTEDQRLSVEELLGKTVEVKTKDEQGAEHIHFSGFIYSVRLVYEVWGSYTAHLTAVSSSYLLDVTAHKQYYAAQTLSSVARTIAGRDNVPISVNAGGGKALNYVQYGETDFSFLNRIVDDYAAWMRPSKGGVEIFDSFQSGSSVQWRGENGLIEFSLSGTMSPASFNGSHYDHHVMESNNFQKEARPPQFYDAASRLTGAVQTASQQLPPAFEPQRARAMTLNDYQDQLLAESERSIGGAVTGEGGSRNQNLMAGNTIGIDGVLDAKGTYGLIKVVHQWTQKGYQNQFICTPWKNYRNPEPPEMRTWNGVVPARVVDHNDPKKMGRIKVQFFWQEDGSTHWARATSPHAGPDRGFMFMPEVGDEVAVAFEDGDPERPVILGSLWNGVQTAPRYDFRGGDIASNDVKRLVTKAGN